MRLLLWATKRVGRPVKWIATRSEVFLADHQGRDQISKASLALDADGRFLALRVESEANLGAYLAGSSAAVQTFQYAFLPGDGLSRSRRSICHVYGVFTNTTPIGVLRGPGYAEANNIMERLIDEAARQCGFDRVELRPREPGASGVRCR
jgi:carbon-monoxide dehydrogenase large subunit